MPPAPPDDLHQLAALLVGRLKPTQAEPLDWERLRALAALHEVLPSFLNEAARFSSQPERWHKALLRHKLSYALREDTIRALQNVFDQARIPALWLKGAALAYQVYGAAWLRPMRDLDLFVPFERRTEALALSEAQGWQRIESQRSPRTRELLEYLSHHYVLTAPDQPLSLELHYDVFKVEARYAPHKGIGALWEHSQALVTPVGLLRVQTPEAAVSYIAAHDVLQHGRLTEQAAPFSPLKRKFDLYLLMTGREIDWAAALQFAETFGWAEALGAAVRETCTLFGCPLPTALADLPAPHVAPINRLRQFAQLPLHLRLAFLAYLALPTESELRRRYQLAPEMPLAGAYLRHFREGVGKAGRYASSFARNLRRS